MESKATKKQTQENADPQPTPMTAPQAPREVDRARDQRIEEDRYQWSRIRAANPRANIGEFRPVCHECAEPTAREELTANRIDNPYTGIPIVQLLCRGCLAALAATGSAKGGDSE